MGLCRARFADVVAALAILTLVAGCGGGGDGDPGTGVPRGDLSLQAVDFSDGEPMPRAVSCDGRGLAPDLRISGPPDDAVELILTVTDPDAPGGTFGHGAAWGFEPSVTNVFTPVLFDPVSRTAIATNDFGDVGFGPPCPPEGDGPHRYVFTLYALGEPSDLEPGVAVDEVIAAAEAKAIAATTLTGTYER